MIAKKIFLLVHPFYGVLPEIWIDDPIIKTIIEASPVRYGKGTIPMKFASLVAKIWINILTKAARDKDSVVIVVKNTNLDLEEMKRDFQARLMRARKSFDFRRFFSLGDTFLELQGKFIDKIKELFGNDSRLFVVDDYIFWGPHKDSRLAERFLEAGITVNDSTKMFAFGETTACVRRNMALTGEILGIPIERQIMVESATNVLTPKLRERITERYDPHRMAKRPEPRRLI